jgi:hypothetical protein
MPEASSVASSPLSVGCASVRLQLWVWFSAGLDTSSRGTASSRAALRECGGSLARSKHGRKSQTLCVPSPYRQPRRIRVPRGDRRPRRECRPTSVHRCTPPPRTGAAHSRAARRGLRGRLQLSAFSDQLSACFPERDALGRAAPPRHAPPRRETAGRAKKHGGGCRHYTDISEVFPCRAATVASTVNPPELRPSVSATSADRRRAHPSSTAMIMARSGSPLAVAMSGAFGSAGACRRVGHCRDRLRALPAGRCRRPVAAPAVRCPSLGPPAGGWGCAARGRRAHL